MLAGEYAVLRGGHSLAVTVDTGMTVKVHWEPMAASWTIKSDLWRESKVVEDDHSHQKDILCRAVQFAAKKTGLHGGTVSVTSALDVHHGLGSSSALRLGVCGAFFALQQAAKSGSTQEIQRESMHCAWQLQSEAQGLASGYDAVTQFVGGLVEFNFDYSDNKWAPHWFKHQIEGLDTFVHVFVGGSGAPTTQTMQTTNSWLDFGNRFEKFIDSSETLVDSFNVCIQQHNARSLKSLINACAASRGLFVGSPYFPNKLAASLSVVPGIDQKWSWKTTGAGGEDAILLIGQKNQLMEAFSVLHRLGWQPFQGKFSDTGARIVPIKFEETSSKPSQQSLRDPVTNPTSVKAGNEVRL